MKEMHSLSFWLAASFIAFIAESISSTGHLVRAVSAARFRQFDIVDEHLAVLRAFIAALVAASERENERCFVIITDDFYLTLYDQTIFREAPKPPTPLPSASSTPVAAATTAALRLRSYYVLRVSNTDDMALQRLFGQGAWHQLHIRQCNLHFITISNGLHAKRLVRFIYRQRLLNVHTRFVILHDSRLLEHDMWPIWCNMLSTIFLQHIENSRLRILGIPFPNILNGIVITRALHEWQAGKRLPLEKIFPSLTNLHNLQGMHVPVVIYEHVPMVMRGNAVQTNGKKQRGNILDVDDTHYAGVEVEIMRALGVVLNFRPVFYAPSIPNGSYAALLAEIINYNAIFAIGDLHPYEGHRNHIDLSWPHSVECLTFLTPESSRDDNWRTLLQPFSFSMWACVFLSLALVGTIFYIISYLNSRAHRCDDQSTSHKSQFFGCLRPSWRWPEFQHEEARHMRLRMLLHRRPKRLQAHERADMFDRYANCILLTYSMLLYVALPRMPRNWPLRVLTGWFWVYCILVTVTYRASLTAILANPAARITIDTLEDLRRSHVTTTVSIAEDKQLFDNATDELARAIGERIEIISDIYSVTERIAKENFAYYDNTYFLRHLRLDDDTHRDGEEVLHIMHECVVQMPVVIGMVKNSILKNRVDFLLHYLSESGLLKKWLTDVTENLNAVEKPPQEAIVSLSKIWSSFIAWAVGLLLAVCAIIGEQLHYRYIVCNHPLYDEYNRHFYYNFRYHMRSTPNTQFRIQNTI